MLRLCREFGFRLHIVPFATSEGGRFVTEGEGREAADDVETCPHYLAFSAEEIPDGATLISVRPPIRSRENCEKLWRALREGVIDFVVTDHSPCPPEMKKLDEGNFQNGVGRNRESIRCVACDVDGSEQARVTLTDIARWMAAGPAKIGEILRAKRKKLRRAGCGSRCV